MEKINSEEKKVMPADLLSAEEYFKLIGQGCTAAKNQNFEEADRILSMFKLGKPVENFIRSAYGENELQRMKNKGIIFGEE